MTMFSLPNFCRVCLKYEKNLIDLAHIENEPNETLMTKLQHCVSEVEWNLFKPLLCHPCIKRLNTAYSFKKQCVQSASILKNYIELVKESQKKNESPATVVCDNNIPQGGAYMLLPNQKYVKILVGSQNQGNSFQNVFLNLIPATTLNAVSTDNAVAPNNKDTNQNVFLNLNNTFQKFVPIVPSDTTGKNAETNVNQLLTETKTEELSVEIDPTDFTGLGEDDDDNDSSENCGEDNVNDWDEVISQSKIDSKDLRDAKNQNGTQNGVTQKSIYSNYVPILPKTDDFVNSGQHFLSQSLETTGEYSCEHCQKSYSNVKQLRQHIKLFHLGKLPFKCEYCYNEFVLRSDYELCMNTHKLENQSSNNSLTLEDFANTSSDANNSQSDANVSSTENGEFLCDICKRPFNSSTGLLRHKVRKHNQQNKKKYFIKGMKNAKCDICNREFSTQSYMQLHRKLHLRDDIGYKYKVFGKSKYDSSKVENMKEDVKDEEPENIDVTPDLLCDDSDSQEARSIKDERKVSESSNNDECGDREVNGEKEGEVKMEVEAEEETSDRQESEDGISDEN